MPRQHWKRRDGVQIVAPNGLHLCRTDRKSRALALALVAAGLAKLQFNKPLIIVMISIRKIGTARIPDDCKNFIEEYKALAGYFFSGCHKTRKPRSSVEHISVDEGYIPLPVNYHR